MNHIDLSTVLRQTVSCDLYSNLVTRPTGVAIRSEIERLIGEARRETRGDARAEALTIIDFSHVSMIDFSCADEVIAKLLLRYGAADAPHDAYFLFRGLTEDHWDAIEAVLERRQLAAVIEQADGARVVGVLPDDERRVWEALYRLGPATPDEVARELALDVDWAGAALAALWDRRLVMRLSDRWVAVGGGTRGRRN